jgi:F-type H+-transporting ATPase subunit b
VAGLTFGLPAVAVAAGGGADVAHTLEDSLKPMAFHALNLLMLLGFLGYLVGPRIKTALAARADEIARDIDGAGAAEAEAQDKFAELSAKLDGFEAALAQMRSDTEMLATADRDALVARAHREVGAIKEGAQRTIRDESTRATVGLRAEAARLAVGLAARRVADQIGEEDHKRLDGEFLNVLGVQEVGHG